MNLSGHHRITLEKIFSHPVSHNIEWHDVRSLLGHLGTVEQEHDGRLRVTLGDRTIVFDAAHHHHEDSLDEQQVVDIRRMLGDAGITPDQVD